MIRRMAIVLVLIFSAQFLSCISASAYTPFSDIRARSAMLVERETGQVLFSHNEFLRHPADGLTKIMTLLIAAQKVENDEISDNELIMMTETAWHDIGELSTTQEILPGEEMTFIDLMYSAYVGRANEACNMLALRIAGSTESFVRMMNDQATEIGLLNTRFENPHGQYHENQYTTAHDMILLYSEASKSQLFAEISSTFRHITEGAGESEPRTLTSSNDLLNQNRVYYYRYCISGISSGTFEGGYSLIATAEEDGLSLIAVVLGAEMITHEDESTNMRNFSETHRLFLWGYSQFAWRDILRTTDLLARVPILHGSGAEFVNARPVDSLTLLLSNSIPTDDFKKDVIIFSEANDDPLIAPISAGHVLGEVIISLDGEVYAKITLVANTDIDLNGVEFMRRQIVEMLSSNAARNVVLVLIALVLVYVALVVRYNIVRANRLRRIKNAKNDIIRDRHQNFRE